MNKQFPQKECSRIPWVLVKQAGKKIGVSRLKCKCWNCKECGPRRQKTLQYQARDGRPTKLITLTASDESGSTPTEQAQALRSAWRTIRRRARKTFFLSKVEFLAVFEKTKRGAPHLHILCRLKYIPQRWLSEQMASLTSSPIVDIRRIKNKRMAANYVSKYIAKAPERFDGCKRYWRSLDYIKPKRRETHTAEGLPILWYIVRTKLEPVVKYLSNHGFELKDSPEHAEMAWSHNTPPPIRPGHVHEVRWSAETGTYAR